MACCWHTFEELAIVYVGTWCDAGQPPAAHTARFRSRVVGFGVQEYTSVYTSVKTSESGRDRFRLYRLSRLYQIVLLQIAPSLNGEGKTTPKTANHWVQSAARSSSAARMAGRSAPTVTLADGHTEVAARQSPVPESRKEHVQLGAFEFWGLGRGPPMVTTLVGEYTAMPTPCVACIPMKARNRPMPAEVASMMALPPAASHIMEWGWVQLQTPKSGMVEGKWFKALKPAVGSRPGMRQSPHLLWQASGGIGTPPKCASRPVWHRVVGLQLWASCNVLCTVSCWCVAGEGCVLGHCTRP